MYYIFEAEVTNEAGLIIKYKYVLMKASLVKSY